jgi:hypothetical protein
MVEFSTRESSVSIVGEWVLNYDFRCMGQYAQAPLRFNADGTCVIPDTTGDAGGDTPGKWMVRNGKVLFQFHGQVGENRATYGGDIEGNAMVGIMAFGDEEMFGCWFAVQRVGAVRESKSELSVSGRPTK